MNATELIPMHSLRIIVSNQSAVIERVLRVIRHRGFELCGMHIPVAEAASLSLMIVVRSESRALGHARPELLCSQLKKLVDVESVRCDVYEQEELRSVKLA